MNRSHRGGHDHPDDNALTIGCSACIARVEHDQAEAAWAVAPLRRCTWTFKVDDERSLSFALDVRVPAGVEPWEVDERYCDLRPRTSWPWRYLAWARAIGMDADQAHESWAELLLNIETWRALR